MSAFSPQQFIEAALKNNVLRFGEFTLKSGRISPYFFNAGLLATGELLSLLAKGYAETLAKNATDDLVIFGAAYKGIPFVAATAQQLWQAHGINAEWGYNRKEAKDHGEGGVLVGADLAGKSVWVIDDVMTAGTAMREVVALLDNAGAKVAGVVVALDRKEKGQGEQSAIAELAQSLQVPVLALVTMDDIIEYVANQGTPQQLAQMIDYRNQYGCD
ncbi:orotate phosphoribosyltransferase [Moraxella cuniculi DSM 21768]|uniref:Orotate phosphoribosyltransferase n=2 Tax=Moraxella cuniculi TaxID=34061 RepID=A0A1N7E305_9GAMM|nr:orotate phosphoribosyltransferase [Moraxella cuniculi]OOS04640.1 orotate phosphoribosyltransferase [Moraxella cuniculi]SIR82434.1 orotate phosphoribosyltransferase [Moraxella cuniculi DSM 21768]VEG12889.1 Orotate phosphoribosyltransferase [Moraxella cuniculi]